MARQRVLGTKRSIASQSIAKRGGEKEADLCKKILRTTLAWRLLGRSDVTLVIKKIR